MTWADPGAVPLENPQPWYVPVTPDETWVVRVSMDKTGVVPVAQDETWVVLGVGVGFLDFFSEASSVKRKRKMMKPRK